MADLTEIGATGLQQWSGHVRDEFLPELQGPRGVKVYREMANNDAVIGATLFALGMLMRRVSWTVEPDTPEAEEDKLAAAFVEECRGDMSQSWSDFLRECLSYLTYGWAYHEIVYKLRSGESADPSSRSRYTDGKIGWRKLPIRAQATLSRWAFDAEGGLQGMHQSPPPSFTERLIPIDKALLFRAGAERGNPEGRSILRTAYRAWYFGKRIEEIEAIGIERDLAGLPIIRVPGEWMLPNASADQKQALQEAKKIATSIRRNEHEGLVEPAMFDKDKNQLFEIRLLASGGKRTFDTDKIVARYDQRKAMTVLADFILLGHEQVGSNALGVTKAELFVTAIEAFLGDVCDVFNRHGIPRLLGVNGMKGRCTLKAGQVDRVNLEELGAYISDLSGAQVLLSEDRLGRHLRRAANLPEELEDAGIGKRRPGFRKAARGQIRGRVAKAERDADAHDQILQIADAVAPSLRARFLAAIAAVRSETDLEALAAALSAGDVDGVERVIAWVRLGEEFASCVEELGQVFAESGQATVALLGERIEESTFDAAAPRGAAWVRERGAALVTQVTETSREAIRNAVARSIEAGHPPDAAALLIRDQVGLTERDAGAVERFRERLLEAGVSEAKAERRTARYAQRKLEDRADTIAGHETLEAAGAGRHEAWTQAQEEGLIEDGVRRQVIPGADERTCTICGALAGKTFGMDEDIIPGVRHTPLHVLCRCPEVLVFPA